MHLNKSRTEEVPVIAMKNVYHLKAYVMLRIYTLYILIHHIIDEHYQLVIAVMYVNTVDKRMCPSGDTQ